MSSGSASIEGDKEQVKEGGRTVMLAKNIRGNVIVKEEGKTVMAKKRWRN